jgi:membrane-bound ClpP family serine protease
VGTAKEESRMTWRENILEWLTAAAILLLLLLFISLL